MVANCGSSFIFNLENARERGLTSHTWVTSLTREVIAEVRPGTEGFQGQGQ